MTNKLFESRHIIRFPDCDAFNHLNNSRYLDYFINAREDHLREFCSFDIYGFAQKTGKSWVVGQSQIAYFFPAFLMETVIIQSVLLEWNPFDVLVELRMWDEKKARLKSFLWIRFIHYDLSKQKRIEHDEYLTKEFSQLEHRLATPETFEQRLQTMKSKKFDTI
jgi:YbgC/YbaW family acyl-CoA thioester hydrolase